MVGQEEDWGILPSGGGSRKVQEETFMLGSEWSRTLGRWKGKEEARGRGSNTSHSALCWEGGQHRLHSGLWGQLGTGGDRWFLWEIIASPSWSLCDMCTAFVHVHSEPRQFCR